MKGHPFEFGFNLRLVPAKLTDPLRWGAPKKVFVNSMSDLFHEGVPDDYIVRVAEIMTAAPFHMFQVLTKRAQRMRTLLNGKLRFAADQQHILWGVSVEDQKYGLPRIDDLRDSPAKRRFLSVEPLLEDLGIINLDEIDWVIVGGESGRGARPIKREWVISLRDQCEARGIPFFFKQWGGVRKKMAGNLLDGKKYMAFPDIPKQPALGKPERRALIERFANWGSEESSLVQIRVV